MKKILSMVFGLLLLVGLTGCNNANENREEFKVVTTFFPMYDFTRNIVGDLGSVSMVVPAGVDSHHFEPSARDIANIEQANAFVFSSEEMESWVHSTLESINTESVKVIEASAGIEMMAWDGEGSTDHSHDHDSEDHSHDDDHGHEDDHDHDHDSDGHDHDHSHDYDPHVWLSPVLAIRQVENIRDGLIQAYPEHEEAFRNNAQAYIEKLEVLDREFHEALDGASQRTIVTQHMAFAYLAREYNLHAVSIAGISPDHEPSAARLAELKHFVEDNDIRVIYFSETANDAVAATLASETGVELAVLNPLESLTQAQIDAGEDYLSIMRANLQALLLSVR